MLERAVHAIAEQAAKTNRVIDEATAAGLAADHPVTIAAKQVRLELLKVKADLERELGTWVLDCKTCDQEVHWVQGISMADPGHWDIDSPRRMATRWCKDYSNPPPRRVRHDATRDGGFDCDVCTTGG